MVLGDVPLLGRRGRFGDLLAAASWCLPPATLLLAYSAVAEVWLTSRWFA